MTDYDMSEAQKLLADYADEHPPDDDPSLVEERQRAAEALLVELKKLNGATGIAIEDHPQKPGRVLMRFPRHRTAEIFADEGEVLVTTSLLQEQEHVKLHYNRLTRRLEGKKDDLFQPMPPERVKRKRSALAVVVETAIEMLPP